MAPKSKSSKTAAPAPAPVVEVAGPAAPSVPDVVGINFGNSFASIAVYSKEGIAECIANEDGERQIACAIAFQGEEIYIGNQAKHQLVKNSQNTILGFRNLLGKKFSEISQDKASKSAPVIQHPEIADEPAYKVQILQPAPKPMPVSARNTPAASHAATPSSEPIAGERILTVSEVATLFIKTLVQSAEDFIGKKVHGAVISVPSWFTEAQKAALTKAAENAGVRVLQLLEEVAAVASTTTAEAWNLEYLPDRLQLVVDLGASALELSLLSVREGLAYAIASSSDHTIGGDQIDDKLIKFFAKEFTKKTKMPLSVAPSTEASDKRAEAKLRLAVEHTKRTLSASPGAATCSVESLKDGMDFTGSINRMRFDMEARVVYTQVFTKVKELIATAGLDLHDVDEVVYVGGSASLPGLDETLAQGLKETVDTPFTAGTVAGGGSGDPTTVIARGCASQALLLASFKKEDAEIKKAFAAGSEVTSVKATSKTLGVLFPEDNSEYTDVGGLFVGVVFRETALPARRTVTLAADLGNGPAAAKTVAMEVWEVNDVIEVEKVAPPKFDDDDDEEEEDLEVKKKVLQKVSCFGSLEVEAKSATKVSGRWQTKIEVQFVVSATGALSASANEVGGEKVTLDVAAAL